ncbi:hypothetical protein BU17DRAFT_102324 [Hysterangium stoloniferum]|nr:hypothetical protein BU17DRAFT_102324 [Hysterangium stoloniferum]
MASPQSDDCKPESLDDPLLSPLFLSASDSNSSTAASTSTTTVSSSSSSSSHDAESPRNDWWSTTKPDALDDLNLNMSFNFPCDQWGMDLDTDITSFISDTSHQFSIDPNALHFGNNVYGGSGAEQDQLSDSMFQFTVSRPLHDSSMSSMSNVSNMSGNAPVQQLPTPAAASASSRSTSPESIFSNTGVNPSHLSLMEQLSQRAREAAGITHAVSASKETLLQPQLQAPVSPVSPVSTGKFKFKLDAQIPQPKLPIPRLRPNTLPAMNVYANLLAQQQDQQQQQQLGPTIPPALAAVPVPVSSPVPTPPQLTKSGRPKTSHTTIERRYRTNLNARILALRRAVPALRILEKGVTQTQQGKGLTGASAPKWDFNDVINERGYVDGVKAAKKNSKGVVLGKAVEYIKALKRRELRLTREADGLKSLVSGLVGGPKLLQTWEQEWRGKFGGEEADEVDEEGDEDDDDDGGEGEDDEDDEEGGVRRKRAKMEKKGGAAPANSAVNVATATSGNAEKRKRGRPRKVLMGAEAPRLVLHPPGLGVQQQQQQQAAQQVQAQQQQSSQPQPSKYLLAAFALFSFFNTAPSSYSYSNAHTNRHSGSVLTPSPSSAQASFTTPTTLLLITWTPLQMMNTVVSVLLLISLVSGYLPQSVRAYVPGFVFAQPPAAVHMLEGERAADEDETSDEDGDEKATKHDRDGADGFNPSVESAPGKTNASGTLGRLVRVVVKSVMMGIALGKGNGLHATARNVRMWRCAAEEIVLRGPSKTSLIQRIKTYLSFSASLRVSSASHHALTYTSTTSISPSSASPSTTSRASDQITLALLALPISSSTAERRWNEARKVADTTAFEKLVLGMSVEEAAEVVKSSYGHSQLHPTTTTSVSVPTSASAPAQRQSPAQYIASYTVGLKTKEIAARQFVECVNIGSGAGVEAGTGVGDEEDRTQTQNQNQRPAVQVQGNSADQTPQAHMRALSHPHSQPYADDTTVLQAGKELGGRLADLTRMIEKCAGSIGVGITGVSVASGANTGLGMSATTISPSSYLYPHELTDILEESESECSSESEEDGVTGVGEEDMVRDAKLIMMTTMLYRYIFTVSAASAGSTTTAATLTTTTTGPTGALPAITTAATIPIPAPSCPEPPAAMLLALRRALGNTAFDLTPDMEDARDRIVDVLADMGRGAGRVGVC